MRAGRRGFKPLMVVAVLAAALPFGVVAEASAKALPGGHQSGCRASPVNLLGIEPVVANPAEFPCRSDSQPGAGAPSGAPGGPLASATTESFDDPRIVSRARLVGVDVPLLGSIVAVGVIEAQASVTCSGGVPVSAGTSRVLGLTIDGQPIAADTPLDVPLAIGTLHVNRITNAAGVVTVRPLWIETPIGSVVLGEARASFTGFCPASGPVHDPNPDTEPPPRREDPTIRSPAVAFEGGDPPAAARLPADPGLADVNVDPPNGGQASSALGRDGSDRRSSGDAGNGLISGAVAVPLIGLPLLAAIAAAVWFLLIAPGRRRDEGI